MKKEFVDNFSLDNYLGCLGNFRADDPVCKSLCVLSLRCSIEHEKNIRMTLLEELVSFDDVLLKIQ